MTFSLVSEVWNTSMNLQDHEIFSDQYEGNWAPNIEKTKTGNQPHIA